jgi:hypothetical protein
LPEPAHAREAATVPPPSVGPAGSLSRYAKGLRWVVRSRVAERPALYLPLARRKYRRPGPTVVGPRTELVIDGFTRSAVTFAVYGFQLAQRHPVRLAHHLHAPAQFIEAARRGTPALATIRDPEEAILSVLVREPFVSPRAALMAYARFHERLLPYRSSFVVADFREVTTDLGSVIGRVNQRFGTEFDEFEHTPENVQMCFTLVEIRTRKPPWDHVLGEFESGLIGPSELRAELERNAAHLETPLGAAGVERAARPSAERQLLKQQLRGRILDQALTPLRERARRIYERIQEAG